MFDSYFGFEDAKLWIMVCIIFVLQHSLMFFLLLQVIIQCISTEQQRVGEDTHSKVFQVFDDRHLK